MSKKLLMNNVISSEGNEGGVPVQDGLLCWYDKTSLTSERAWLDKSPNKNNLILSRFNSQDIRDGLRCHKGVTSFVSGADDRFMSEDITVLVGIMDANLNRGDFFIDITEGYLCNGFRLDNTCMIGGNTGLEWALIHPVRFSSYNNSVMVRIGEQGNKIDFKINEDTNVSVRKKYCHSYSSKIKGGSCDAVINYIIAYNRSLSDEEIETIQQYLKEN